MVCTRREGLGCGVGVECMMIAFCLQDMWERRIELLGYCIGEGRCCSTLAILSGSLGMIGEFSVTVYY